MLDPKYRILGQKLPKHLMLEGLNTKHLHKLQKFSSWDLTAVNAQTQTNEVPYSPMQTTFPNQP